MFMDFIHLCESRFLSKLYKHPAPAPPHPRPPSQSPPLYFSDSFLWPGHLIWPDLTTVFQSQYLTLCDWFMLGDTFKFLGDVIWLSQKFSVILPWCDYLCPGHSIISKMSGISREEMMASPLMVCKIMTAKMTFLTGLLFTLSWMSGFLVFCSSEKHHMLA